MIYFSFCLMDTDFNQEDFLKGKVLKRMNKDSITPGLQRCVNSEGFVIILGKEWNQLDTHGSSWSVASLDSLWKNGCF